MTELELSRRAVRVSSVTGGLVVSGAGLGALTGSGLMVGLGLLYESGGGGFDWSVVGAAGAIGSAIGAVALPTLSWTLLRDVPLGRVLARTSFGALLGGMAGLVVPAAAHNPAIPIVAAAIGAVASALILRLGNPSR